MSFIKPRSIREWMMIALIGITVAVCITLPVYVVREINNETEDIMARIDRQVVEDQETLVRVNVATIACLYESDSAITAPELRMCMDELLTQVEEG